MANIKEIEGIGEVFGARLEAAGIKTEDSLLKEGASKSGRATIAQTCGIDETKILEWVNRADIARIKGIGSEYADLLECAGVDSVPELANRNAENLTTKMTELNATKNLVRSLPTTTTVAAWIEEAKTLDRIVTY